MTARFSQHEKKARGHRPRLQWDRFEFHDNR